MKFTLENLPKIRGEYRFDYPLSKVTWFGVGGNADILFKPKDEEDLSFFLKHRPKDLPYICFGVFSNVIILDEGFRGVVIRLGREFAGIKKISDNQIKVGAGALDANIARFSAENEIANLEFLVGIPGSLGGAIAMNGGAYGSELKDILVSATAIDEDGNIIELKNENFSFKYRGNLIEEKLSKKLIYTSAILQGEKSSKEKILEKMNFISSSREATQPVRAKTGGSTFKNPKNSDKKAWQLIDEAGCRGLKMGGAIVSEKHCNFLINQENATASDIINLGEEVRKRVFEKSGVMLEWEIKIFPN
ncbi:MAG: UDP-N-acetylmuramate dehydrogenase [Rickettsiales bacterium]|nr:UDP-N-acetylmuramate dehydrogenase [Rickettsiales bacterium]